MKVSDIKCKKERVKMNTEGVEVKLDMLTGMIQELGDEIKGKLNILKEDWREVQKQIQELKKDTEIIKGQVDELKKGEGEPKNRKLVIFGWKYEVNENNFETYNRVRELFAKVLRISLVKIWFRYCCVFWCCINRVLMFRMCSRSGVKLMSV